MITTRSTPRIAKRCYPTGLEKSIQVIIRPLGKGKSDCSFVVASSRSSAALGQLSDALPCALFRIRVCHPPQHGGLWGALLSFAALKRTGTMRVALPVRSSVLDIDRRTGSPLVGGVNGPWLPV